MLFISRVKVEFFCACGLLGFELAAYVAKNALSRLIRKGCNDLVDRAQRRAPSAFLGRVHGLALQAASLPEFAEASRLHLRGEGVSDGGFDGAGNRGSVGHGDA